NRWKVPTIEEAMVVNGPPDLKAQFNLIDLFAGVGGFTLGFRDEDLGAGCRFLPRLMVDIDRKARDVSTRNIPEVPYLAADIHELGGADIRRAAGLDPVETIHVLVGGPPCQG